MFKQMLSGPGHVAAAIAASGVALASHSAAAGLATYGGIRALQAATQAPSDKELADRNRNLSEKQFGKK